jgi:hypothetical protein
VHYSADLPLVVVVWLWGRVSRFGRDWRLLRVSCDSCLSVEGSDIVLHVQIRTVNRTGRLTHRLSPPARPLLVILDSAAGEGVWDQAADYP